MAESNKIETGISTLRTTLDRFGGIFEEVAYLEYDELDLEGTLNYGIDEGCQSSLQPTLFKE
ncbi:hypothetical protein BDV29DRAFT_183465 [Aspergillus leporis]|uniref:Uncharacterized protein n=1 Tax=Aspergillus leporis TaxID=41062 RepID=A0A5N5WKI8_9EURO|nr:hypothetical protein BDV29DRAFT_183465 [Aspergillus leporis]